MGSSARPIDNEPQKCYNANVLSDVFYKRITEKANYPKKRKCSVNAVSHWIFRVAAPFRVRRLGFCAG